MATFLLTMLLFLLVFAAMSVGVLFANKPIKGSCGGLNTGTAASDCALCGGNRDRCEQTQAGSAELESGVGPQKK
ncbi:MAG TPA: (Na+)-NQR maturation NqrM [Dongiaceae bacterium]|nr:(Na+)-NQR maturation NqrM [Dongiaceae bacterium]